MKVRLTKVVRSDPGFIRPMVAEPGVYEAGMNAHGAVWIVLPHGECLGVRPGEFEFEPASFGEVQELRREFESREQMTVPARLYIQHVTMLETMLLQTVRRLVDGGFCPAADVDWEESDCPTGAFGGGEEDEPVYDIDPGKCSERDRVRCALKWLGEQSGQMTCRKCGCTQENACEGGCSWVEEDLCSACVEPAEGDGDADTV